MTWDDIADWYEANGFTEAAKAVRFKWSDVQNFGKIALIVRAIAKLR